MIIYVFLISLFSLAFAVYLAYYVLKQDKGSPKMQEIANAIKEGANAFIKSKLKDCSSCKKKSKQSFADGNKGRCCLWHYNSCNVLAWSGIDILCIWRLA